MATGTEGGLRLLAVRRVPGNYVDNENVYEVGDAAVFLEPPAASLRYPIWDIGIADVLALVDLSLS